MSTDFPEAPSAPASVIGSVSPGRDYELWLRIATRGYLAVRAEGILAVHRDHPGSLTSGADKALTRAAELYETIAVEHVG